VECEEITAEIIERLDEELIKYFVGVYITKEIEDELAHYMAKHKKCSTTHTYK
jgi:translation initiation factor 2 beta subunit (eIF-2beta)/eIF-5